jgi:hypothetical protein
VWSEHRERVVEWRERVEAMRAPRRARAFDAYWKVQSWRDGVPA